MKKVSKNMLKNNVEWKNIIDDNPEIISRIFDMMKEFAETIEFLENILWTNHEQKLLN